MLLRLLLAALALGLLGNGCGAIPEEDARRSDWARQANEICADLKRRFADVEAPRTEEEWYTGIRLILRADEASLAELRRLDPPPGESANVSKFLDLYEAHDELAARAVVAKERNDEAAARTLIDQSLTLGGQADALARDLGAVECAAPEDVAGR